MTSRTFEATADQVRVGDRVIDSFKGGVVRHFTVAAVESAGGWVYFTTPEGGYCSVRPGDPITITREVPKYEVGKPYLVTPDPARGITPGEQMLFRVEGGWADRKDDNVVFLDRHVLSAEPLRIAGPHEVIVNVAGTNPEHWEGDCGDCPGAAVADAMRDQGVQG